MARVAILGSGPAGFYAAQALLRRDANVAIDILERLPVPFGLVRYGIAPDHAATRNVIHGFSQFMRENSSRVRFFGNIPAASENLRLDRLSDMYDLVIHATGASKPRALGKEVYVDPRISSQVRFAHEFIMWVNGHPGFHDESISGSLQGRLHHFQLPSYGRLLVIGMGNVALDIARLLLRPVDDLRSTDISPVALEAISTASLNEVVVVGRRGPEHAAWTTAALREVVTKIPGIKTKVFSSIVRNSLMSGNVSPSASRGLKLLLDHGLDISGTDAKFQSHPMSTSGSVASRQLRLEFLKSPISFNAAPEGGSNELHDVMTHTVSASFRNNTCDFPASSSGVTPMLTENDKDLEHSVEQCGAVLLSLGYEGGKQNFDKVSVGWANGKGRGIVGDNKWDAETVIQALPSLAPAGLASSCGISRSGIVDWLRETGHQAVDWSGWERIDEEEKRRGKRLCPNRERYKLERISEMLAVAEGNATPMSKLGM